MVQTDIDPAAHRTTLALMQYVPGMGLEAFAMASAENNDLGLPYLRMVMTDGIAHLQAR